MPATSSLSRHARGYGTKSNLSSSIRRPFDCLANCKCTAKSPCCKQCCGSEGSDYCMCGTDTHQYDEEDNNKPIEQVSVISDKYFRPAEVEELLGDSSKATKELGWKPTITFDNLIKDMVEHDC